MSFRLKTRVLFSCSCGHAILTQTHWPWHKWPHAALDSKGLDAYSPSFSVQVGLSYLDMNDFLDSYSETSPVLCLKPFSRNLVTIYCNGYRTGYLSGDR